MKTRAFAAIAGTLILSGFVLILSSPSAQAMNRRLCEIKGGTWAATAMGGMCNKAIAVPVAGEKLKAAVPAQGQNSGNSPAAGIVVPAKPKPAGQAINTTRSNIKHN
jgi:hypothetical protein